MFFAYNFIQNHVFVSLILNLRTFLSKFIVNVSCGRRLFPVVTSLTFRRSEATSGNTSAFVGNQKRSLLVGTRLLLLFPVEA